MIAIFESIASAVVMVYNLMKIAEMIQILDESLRENFWKIFFALLCLIVLAFCVGFISCKKIYIEDINNESCNIKDYNYIIDKSYFDGNSKYVCYFANITWEEAEVFCEQLGGHLLIIDSEEEYDYIVDQLTKRNHTERVFYIGANRLFSDSDNTDSGYHWINDKNYNNINKLPFWLNNEPSYKDNKLYVDETYVELYFNISEKRWGMNDIPNDPIYYAPEFENRVGFICEYK